MRFSGLMKGYLVWVTLVSMWLTGALALGWKMPSMGSMGMGASSRSSGGYYPHSSWSFGK